MQTLHLKTKQGNVLKVILKSIRILLNCKQKDKMLAAQLLFSRRVCVLVAQSCSTL